MHPHTGEYPPEPLGSHPPTDQVTKKGPLMVSLGLYASKLAATKALTSQLDDMQVRARP